LKEVGWTCHVCRKQVKPEHIEVVSLVGVMEAPEHLKMARQVLDQIEHAVTLLLEVRQVDPVGLTHADA